MNDPIKSRFEDAAFAAAGWWAEQIGAPKFVNSSPEERAYYAERGEHHVNQVVDTGQMLASMNAAKHPVSDDQARNFHRLLADAIREEMERQGAARYEVSLSLHVDYHPDRMLADAATACGISTSRFPWKTGLWVREKYVTAAGGYQGRTQLVWSAEDWDRPPCGSQQYVKDPRIIYLPWKCSLPVYHEGDHRYDAESPTCSICNQEKGGPWHRERQIGVQELDLYSHAPQFGAYVCCNRCKVGKAEVGTEGAECRRWDPKAGQWGNWVDTGFKHEWGEDERTALPAVAGS